MSVLILRLRHTNRHIFISLGGLLLSLIIFSTAWGKHNEVLCTACHIKSADASAPYTAEALVQPKEALCRTCHDADLDVSGLNPPHVFNGRKELAGGSFTPTLRSDKAGHNIESIDMTLGLTPPGGSAMVEFGCLSCHDSHDNGNYRNLKTEINGNRTLVTADGDPEYRKTVYISGMNGFCSACHEGFDGGRNSRRVHPVEITIAGSEHADVKWWSQLENKVTEAEYPSGNADDPYGAQVFCLSCHRAHASPYGDAMRWDYAKSKLGCLECHTF